MEPVSSGAQFFEIWSLLCRVERLVRKSRAAELRVHGLSGAETGVLHVVNDMYGEATAAEISRQLIKEPHTISSLLTRMIRKGLLTRKRDKNRRNILRISLTEKGNKAFNQALNADSLSKIMFDFSEEEIEGLKSFLQKLQDNAKDHLVSGMKSPFDV
ncbi:MarR family winged helix-turn-helix transcriptional regulator [Chloroflexota bacterium]